MQKYLSDLRGALTLSGLFGSGALKAQFGGLAAIVAYLWTAVGASCDLQAIGQNLGGVAGSFLVGYVLTWLAPQNAGLANKL